MNCKYCNSENTIKFGTYEGVQYHYCKDCKRKFTELDTLPKMQIPINQVASAVSMYYEGLSLSEIKRMLKQIYNTDISDQGIYNWIERFTNDAIKITQNYHPESGYVWLADETVIEINGQRYWLLDVIDVKTRFLLASFLSKTRRIEDIQEVLRKAYARSGKVPKVIMTDHLDAYINAIPLTFGLDTKHLQVKKFTSKPNNNIIERMQGTIKSRTKIMRDLKSPETAKTILDGFFVHYNYMRPHETIKTTPAQKAGIKFPYGNWEQLIRNSPQEKLRIPAVRFDMPSLPVRPLTKAEKQREYERLRKRAIREKQKRQRITSHDISISRIQEIK